LRFLRCFRFFSWYIRHPRHSDSLLFPKLFLSLWLAGPLQLRFAPLGSNLQLRHWLSSKPEEALFAELRLRITFYVTHDRLLYLITTLLSISDSTRVIAL